MALENISYFEFFDPIRNIFVSLFPSNLTTVDENGLPENNAKVFVDDIDEDKTFDILNELQKMNFGFRDFLWFVPKELENDLSFEKLKEWLLSLYYTFPGEKTKHYVVAIMKSSKDENFNLKVYVKSTSLPQEAIDVIPIFVDEKNNEKYVVLGTKKKSDSLKITFSKDKSLDLLTVGLFGKVIFGEHLEKEEKAGMAEIRAQFKNKPLNIKKERQISPALRALFEEGGFSKMENCEFYYVLKHDAYARDSRYWPFGETFVSKECEETYWKYGYPRISCSDTIVALIKGEIPKVLPDPVDQMECDKPVILNCKDAMDLLHSEKYKLAFPSHYHQLEVALASDIFEKNPKPHPAIGLTLVQAEEKGFDNIRSFSRNGHCTFASFSLDRKRMNVAVNEKDVIEHVFGFF